jgi:PAS domain S-box-containing protein
MASEMQPDSKLGFELFELLPDAILAVDRHGVIQYANHQAGRLFGQEPAALVSAPVEALIPEQLRERHIAHRAKYALEPRMRPMGTGLDLVARRADGTTFPVDIMLNPIKIEKQRLVLAVVRDITERKRAETRVQQLMRELRHRVKNILSVVQAMAHQTSANSAQEFVLRFSERIRGLSSSLDLLVKNEWQNVPLAELVRAQLAHFGDLLGNRITVRGMDLRITAAAAQTIGMALHELATSLMRANTAPSRPIQVTLTLCGAWSGLALARIASPSNGAKEAARLS